MLIASRLSLGYSYWEAFFKLSIMAIFDYNHTCPIIDGGIRDIQDTIDSKIYDCFVGETHIDDIDQSRLIKDLTEEITSIFEGVRESNSNMRDAAEKQLNALEDEKNGEIEELQEEIENLKAKIESLEDELYQLKLQDAV